MCVIEALPAQSGARRLLSRIVPVLGLSLSSVDTLAGQSEIDSILSRLRSEARVLLGTCLGGISLIKDIPLDSVEALLATLQALLLMAYDGCGNKRTSQAGSDMLAVADLAHKMRLSQVDAPASTSMSDEAHTRRQKNLQHSHRTAVGGPYRVTKAALTGTLSLRPDAQRDDKRSGSAQSQQ